MSPTVDVNQYENNSIYIILHSRGALPGFHWGIFVPSKTPEGTKWHATNRSGGWELEVRPGDGVPTSQSLCLAFKIGVVEDLKAFGEIMAGVPADGTASRVTGTRFNCVTWVKDALHALQEAGIVVLGQSIEEIEEWAVETAEEQREAVECGRATARVVNEL